MVRSKPGSIAAVAIAGIMGMAGCCTPIIHRAYPMNAPDGAAVAVLRQQDGTYVMRVDGESAPCYKACCREIHVLPGAHEIQFSFFDADKWAKAPCSVRFVAEPGVNYDIHGAETGTFSQKLFSSGWGSRPWTGWIVDTRSGRVVGGDAPAEAE